MTRLFLCAAILLLVWSSSTAQKHKNEKKLSAEETSDLLKNIGLDSAKLLSEAAMRACSCIDSVDKAEDDKQKKKDGIGKCIEEQVLGYQASIKMFAALAGGSNKISVVADKDSKEYRHYYYDIERWLKDSCRVMNFIISTNDLPRDKSFSSDADAMSAYNQGVDLLKQQRYKDCIPWFEKAVSIDSGFAFAWDNLGICYRQTGDYEKAIHAYKSSLEADPMGKTPMQNLAVVYLIEKRDDDAIDAYNRILKYYPDDPEAYYGVGLVYYSNKKDMDNALRNMCKAYNIYATDKSPYRSDAEKIINLIYTEMKKANKEDVFDSILKENHISRN